MSERHWNSELQQWVTDEEVAEAIDAASLVVSEYYNGDRYRAEVWLIRALAANKDQK